MNNPRIYIGNLRKQSQKCTIDCFSASEFCISKPIRCFVVFFILWISGSQQGWGQYYQLEYDVQVTFADLGSTLYSLDMTYRTTTGSEGLIKHWDVNSGLLKIASGKLQIPFDQGCITEIILTSHSEWDDCGESESFPFNPPCIDLTNYDMDRYDGSCLSYKRLFKTLRCYPVLSGSISGTGVSLSSTPITLSYNGSTFAHEAYQWEMNVNANGWQPLPDSFQNRSTITFSASDILANISNYIGDNVQFRLNPCGMNQSMSNIVTYTIAASPPTITLTSASGPKCADSSDGSVIVNLVDRKLAQNETLHLQDDNALFAIDIKPEDINTNLSYNLKIPQGTHNLTYYSTFVTSGSPGYYNSTPQSVGSITIPNAPSPVSFTATPTDVECYGGSDGKITISNAQRGPEPYSYTITGNGITRTGSINSTNGNATESGLSKGTYTIAMWNGNGCTAQDATVTINMPTNPIKITIPTHQDVTTHGQKIGILEASADGGTGPYSYCWTAYNTNNTVSENSIASGLFAGSYTITVKDANYNAATDKNGCIATANATITQPDPLSISIQPIKNTCSGYSKGFIKVSATGGLPINTPAYSYTWYKKDAQGNFQQLSDNGSELSNQSGGFYKIKVADNCISGCTFVNSIEQEIDLSDPPAIVLSSEVKDVDCKGKSTGAIAITATGGTGTLTYSWKNPSKTGNTLTGLSSGYYTAIATDDNGCTGSKEIYVSQPSSLPYITINKANDPKSFNGDNGTIVLNNATGGTPVYNYIWTKDGSSYTPSSPTSLTGLSAGTYNVTIYDANKCEGNTATTTLNNPVPPIDLTVTQRKDVTCYQGNEGAITINPSRVLSFTVPVSYTYQWMKDDILQPALTGNQATDLMKGTYTIKVTDNYGATKSIDVPLTETYSQIIPVLEATAIKCKGDANGQARVSSISGGAGEYTYKWSNGESGSSISGLAPRTYTVTVTSKNCTASASVLVKEPEVLSVSLTPHPPTGYNTPTGYIVTTVQGGNGENTYQWTGVVANSANVSNLVAGDYSVEVTDKLGCTASASTTLAQREPLKVSLVVDKAISCNGVADGTLKATATGGISKPDGYTYTWKKVVGTEETDIISETNTISSLPGQGKGTYKVLVEDAYNNVLLSSNTITLTEPDALAVASSTVTPVKCYGDPTGAIQFAVTGGTGAYTYKDDLGNAITNQLSGLHAGSYPVIITDDHHCRLDASFIVTQPAAPLAVQLRTLHDLSYYKSTDGVLSADVTGGTTPYSYQWTGSNSPNETASNLSSGSYSLTVTDNNQCTATASSRLIDPLKVTLELKDSIRCNGERGQIVAYAVGGEPSSVGLPYSYTLHQIVGETDTPLNLSDSIALNLSEGYYQIEVADTKGRVLKSETLHLTQPDPLQIEVDAHNVTCKNDNNGSVHLSAKGGNGGYTYFWNDGVVGADRNKLRPGYYSVTLTDRKLCATTPSSTSISITEPEKLIIALAKKEVTVAGCDGMIFATVVGGTTPYTYRYNDTDNASDNVIGKLCAGHYTVQVTDRNLCKAADSLLLPPPLVARVSIRDSVNCYGDANGALKVHVGGGVPFSGRNPYRYLWKKRSGTDAYDTIDNATDSIASRLTSGWYAVNITDSLGVSLKTDSIFYLPQPELLSIRVVKNDVLCHGAATGSIRAKVTGGLSPYKLQWNTGDETDSLHNISAGNYRIMATDRHGCSKQYTAIIEQSDTLIVGFSKTTIPSSASACDGSLQALVAGGVAPYSYQWSGGGNSSDSEATALCTGNKYTVAVKDLYGCPAEASRTISSSTSPLQATLSIKDSVACYGVASGSIVAHVTGGLVFASGKPYIYIWTKKNQAGIYRQVGNNNDNILSGITSGWYAFTAKDAENSILSPSVTIYVPEPDTLDFVQSHTDIPCYGNHNGWASVKVSGGSTPYAYHWSNQETTNTVDSLAPGGYVIEVTDRHGCIRRDSVTILEPKLLTVNLLSKPISEHNVCDGKIHAVVAGGTLPYSYQWTGTVSIVDSVTALCQGTYSTSITDAHGCATTAQASFVNPPALRMLLSVVDSIRCYGDANGILKASVSGGVPFTKGYPYHYTWKRKNGRGTFDTLPGYADSIAANLTTGVYSCNITDSHGIALHADSAILLPQPPLLDMTISKKDIGCSGADEGSASASPFGGLVPYAYSWNTGEKTASIDSLSSGAYIVRVTDRHGCIASRQLFITKAAPLSLNFYIKQPVCYQDRNGSLQATVSGGIVPYQYRWAGSSSVDALAGALSAGTYTLSVTDAAGCNIKKGESLANPAQLPLSLGADRFICNGQTIRYDITISNQTGIAYNWTGTNGFASTQPIVDITQAGVYTALVSDPKGCSRTASVTLNPSDIKVENEFVLPTQAFANEKIVVVNTTYPNSDSIRWVLPVNAVVSAMEQSYAEFMVADTGAYAIGMISYKGVCNSVQSKELVVSAHAQLSEVASVKNPFIQSFGIAPNPNHGNFKTKIVLQDKAEVQLRLINIVSNQTVFQTRKTGDSSYDIPVNISLPTGTYLMLLETSKGSATVKVIIF